MGGGRWARIVGVAGVGWCGSRGWRAGWCCVRRWSGFDVERTVGRDGVLSRWLHASTHNEIVFALTSILICSRRAIIALTGRRYATVTVHLTGALSTIQVQVRIAILFFLLLFYGDFALDVEVNIAKTEPLKNKSP